MPAKKLKDYLDREHVHYEMLGHIKAYTAQEIAAAAHIPGKEFAKTVMVKLDQEMVMVVLPADHQLNFGALKKITGASAVELATEEEFKNLFPECEIGAMPPFGNLYNLEVFEDPALAEDQEISFNAGSHTELMRMAHKDFERLVHPTMLTA
jgi:Ala-tRNA(Pro) deacylase